MNTPNEWLTPRQLIEFGTRGLAAIARDIAAIDDPFRAAFERAQQDASTLRSYLRAFESREGWIIEGDEWTWIGGSEEARQRAFLLAEGLSSFRLLFDEVLDAGRDDYFGRWSI